MAVTINIPTQVSQTITNGVTTTAPSEDAVFDALAGKIDKAANATYTINSVACLTAAEYALISPDANTIYFIV